MATARAASVKVAAKFMRENSRQAVPELPLAGMAAISLPRGGPIRKRRSPGSIFRRVSTLMLILSPTRRWKFYAAAQPEELHALEAAARAAYRAPVVAEWLPRRAPRDHKHAAHLVRRGVWVSWDLPIASMRRAGGSWRRADDCRRFCGAGKHGCRDHRQSQQSGWQARSGGGPPRLAAATCRAGCLLIADEAFADFLDPAPAHSGDARRGMLVLRSFGKAYGLPGLRSDLPSRKTSR